MDKILRRIGEVHTGERKCKPDRNKLATYFHRLEERRVTPNLLMKDADRILLLAEPNEQRRK